MGRVKFLCSILFCAFLFFGVAGLVYADDGSWGTVGDPCEISWIGDGFTLDLDHEDSSPFKGWATLTVKNTGTQDWGDFHFGFYDPIGGQTIDNLAFLEGLDPNGVNIDPTSTQSPLTWDIDNDTIGATIDLFFYSDPLSAGETATFSVYTANPDQLDWFGLQAYPTPVPEPATLLLLSLGGLALRRRK